MGPIRGSPLWSNGSMDECYMEPTRVMNNSTVEEWASEICNRRQRVKLMRVPLIPGPTVLWRHLSAKNWC